MATPITDSDSIYQTLVNFFQAESARLQAGSSPAPLDVSGLEFSNALTYSLSMAEQPAGFQVGASQEAVFTALSIIREYEMASLSKADLIGAAVSEASLEESFYENRGSFLAGVMKGAPTGGSQ